MSHPFKEFDYAATLDLKVSLRQAIPPDHLARFIVDVVSQLDLSRIYARYGKSGGEAYPPEILLGLLFYGYATGVFSSRKIERATYEVLPFRYVAGDMHPDHDTIANFRAKFILEIREFFVQILMLASATNYLKLGNVSVDGTKIHADASKSKAVSYKRLGEIETKIHAQVDELLYKSAQEQNDLPAEMNVAEEIAMREARLAELAQARTVLLERAKERDRHEQEEYDTKKKEYDQREGKRKGKGPKPPGQSGPRDGDQYNFTDPDSRIGKNSTDKGFNQTYNAQIAVEQDSMLIVGVTLSNHGNDQLELLPTLLSIPTEIGKPMAAAADNGYFSETNIKASQKMEIDPYIATGREPHGKNWKEQFGEEPAPPEDGASVKTKMAYKLRTGVGKAIYRLRKCTVEPVFGIIKEVLGFRQFSLRGIEKVRGEWGLVCLCFNLKRMHSLKLARKPQESCAHF